MSATTTPPGFDVLVVINPVAPRYTLEETRKALETALETRGLRFHIFETPAEKSRERIAEEVAAALRAGCSRIIAAGGDGTIAMVAEPIPATNGAAPVTLGIIPGGTANILGRELAIPGGLADAVELAVGGEATLDFDVILTPERLVLTQVGIGPDASMIRDTSREDQQRFGRLAYSVNFVRRALRHRPQRFDLVVDGRPIQARAWQLVVANVGTIGAPPFTWGPRIDPTDAKLDLCIYNVRTVSEYLTLVWRVFTGRHRWDSNTRFLHVHEELEIKSSKPLWIQGDGEILGRTPITLRVGPRRLRIVVPKAVEEVAPPAPVPESAPNAGSSVEGPVAAGPAETIEEDVHGMISEHSRTWVLQGVLRHPLSWLGALDAALFLRVNSLVLAPFLDHTLLAISRIMHYGEGWAVVALTLILIDPATGWRATAEALPVLWLTMLVVNFPMKHIVRRRRPFIAYVKARVLGPRPRDFSLPSGHTAAAFAGAVLFGSHAPVGIPLYYALASVVGFSRIYLGVHYLSDVVIGALAGTFLAMLFRTLLHALVPWFR